MTMTRQSSGGDCSNSRAARSICALCSAPMTPMSRTFQVSVFRETRGPVGGGGGGGGRRRSRRECAAPAPILVNVLHVVHVHPVVIADLERGAPPLQIVVSGTTMVCSPVAHAG